MRVKYLLGTLTAIHSGTRSPLFPTYFVMNSSACVIRQDIRCERRVSCSVTTGFVRGGCFRAKQMASFVRGGWFLVKQVASFVRGGCFCAKKLASFVQRGGFRARRLDRAIEIFIQHFDRHSLWSIYQFTSVIGQRDTT